MFGMMCLMARGIMLTDYVRDTLLRTALEMHRSGEHKKGFKNGACEGVVTTRMETSGIGFFFGIIFEAEIEAESTKKKAVVRFIADTSYAPEDVVDGVPWVPGVVFGENPLEHDPTT